MGRNLMRTAIVLGAVLALTGCNALYGWGGGLTSYGSVDKNPTTIGANRTWVTVDAGMTVPCGIDTAKRLFCGLDGGEQETPTPGGLPADWTALAKGLEHMCALRGSGDLYCRGDNSVGQLGDGTGAGYSPGAKRIGTASDWRSVSAGEYNTCGIRGIGDLYCWGAGTLLGSTVGDGGSVHRSAPTRIGTASNWKSVDVGHGHTCGLRRAGDLYCWGTVVGDGTTQQRLTPTRVGTASDWTTVSVSVFHTCGLRGAGDLYCWGGNSDGQVGDGTTTTRLSPVRIGTDSDWSLISAGGTDRPGGSGGGGEYNAAHTCGLRRPGALYCWGGNGHGEVGDGSTTSRPIPTRIGTATNWSTVSAGGDFTEGIRN